MQSIIQKAPVLVFGQHELKQIAARHRQVVRHGATRRGVELCVFRRALELARGVRGPEPFDLVRESLRVIERWRGHHQYAQTIRAVVVVVVVVVVLYAYAVNQIAQIGTIVGQRNVVVRILLGQRSIVGTKENSHETDIVEWGQRLPLVEVGIVSGTSAIDDIGASLIDIREPGTPAFEGQLR